MTAKTVTPAHAPTASEAPVPIFLASICTIQAPSCSCGSGLREKGSALFLRHPALRETLFVSAQQQILIE